MEKFRFELDSLIKDLVEFTGMASSDVISAVERKRWSSTRQDFTNMNPISPGEVIWFNRTNRTFLFECAIHEPWQELMITLPQPVLDYGAGLGTDCIWLHLQGNRVFYFDINMPSVNFFEWRCGKYGFDIPVVKSCFDGGKFDHVDCITGVYGTIIFRDVLEHICNYEEVLVRADRQLSKGGMLFVQAPFETGVKFGVHMEEKVPVGDWLVKRGYRRISGAKWIKES